MDTVKLVYTTYKQIPSPKQPKEGWDFMRDADSTIDGPGQETCILNVVRAMGVTV